MVVVEIDIGEGDVAARRMRRGILARRTVRDLRRRTRQRRRADHRRVVGAGQRDGDRLAVRAAVAVVDGDDVVLDQRLIGREVIEDGIVHRIIPGDRARAIARRGIRDHGRKVPAIARALRCHTHRVAVVEIDIGEGDVSGRLVGRGILARRTIRNLRRRTLQRRRADHRRVVHAGDRDGDGRGIRCSGKVRGGVRKGVGRLFIDREILEQRSRVV